MTRNGSPAIADVVVGDGDPRGMIDAVRDLAFAEEALADLGLAGELGVQELDRGARAVAVRRREDRAHAADAEEAARATTSRSAPCRRGPRRPSRDRLCCCGPRHESGMLQHRGRPGRRNARARVFSPSSRHPAARPRSPPSREWLLLLVRAQPCDVARHMPAMSGSERPCSAARRSTSCRGRARPRRSSPSTARYHLRGSAHRRLAGDEPHAPAHAGDRHWGLVQLGVGLRSELTGVVHAPALDLLVLRDDARVTIAGREVGRAADARRASRSCLSAPTSRRCPSTTTVPFLSSAQPCVKPAATCVKVAAVGGVPMVAASAPQHVIDVALRAHAIAPLATSSSTPSTPRDLGRLRALHRPAVVRDAAGAPALHLLVGAERARELRGERDGRRVLDAAHDDALVRSPRHRRRRARPPCRVPSSARRRPRRSRTS